MTQQDKEFYGLVVAILLFFLLMVIGPRLDSADFIKAKSLPRVSFSPAQVLVTAYIEPSEKNQWIEFRLTGTNHSEASGEKVFPEDDIFLVDFDDLPSGDYECRVFLVRDNIKYIAKTRFKVVKGAKEQGGK